MAHLPILAAGSKTKGYLKPAPPARTVNLKTGYVTVWVAGVGHQLEHRLVMSRHLGRPLGRNEEVHHKNHVRNDNRLENLEIIESVRHRRLHAKKPTKLVALTCGACGATVHRYPSTVKGYAVTFCNRTCYNSWKRGRTPAWAATPEAREAHRIATDARRDPVTGCYKRTEPSTSR